MSWNAKVHWTEGLFLRPHHLQQADRYLENTIESRARHVTPYPWGFAALEIDRDLAQQSKFALRRAAGIMPDGGLFDFPAQSPAPAPIEAPEAAAGQLVWLTMPERAENAREVSPERWERRSRKSASTGSCASGVGPGSSVGCPTPGSSALRRRRTSGEPRPGRGKPADAAAGAAAGPGAGRRDGAGRSRSP